MLREGRELPRLLDNDWCCILCPSIFYADAYCTAKQDALITDYCSVQQFYRRPLEDVGTDVLVPAAIGKQELQYKGWEKDNKDNKDKASNDDGKMARNKNLTTSWEAGCSHCSSVTCCESLGMHSLVEEREQDAFTNGCGSKLLTPKMTRCSVLNMIKHQTTAWKVWHLCTPRGPDSGLLIPLRCIFGSPSAISCSAASR